MVERVKIQLLWVTDPRGWQLRGVFTELDRLRRACEYIETREERAYYIEARETNHLYGAEKDEGLGDPKEK